jgi:hypothetical protein
MSCSFTTSGRSPAEVQSTAVDAVPRLQDRPAEKGFSCVTISDLLGADQSIPEEKYTEYPGTAQGLP